MLKILTKEFLVKTIFEVVILGGFVFVMKQYFENKYAPITAAETLKRENFLNAKRDAYFQAIEIANKVLANSDFDSIDAFTGKKMASKFLHKHQKDLSEFELDINSVYSKLMIFTSDTSVLSSYFRIFVTPPNERHNPIIEMKKFINAIRKDLGNNENLPDEYKMLYIVMPSKADSIR